MTETLETATTSELALDYDVSFDLEFDSDVPFDLEFDSNFFVVLEWLSTDFSATTLALGEEDCDPWEDAFMIAQASSDPEMPAVVPDSA